jgi:hypothetical protein
MIVRCIRLSNWSGAAVAASAWVTVGRDYRVLTLIWDFSCEKKAMVRLLSDEGVPALFNLADFEITDSRLSAYWQLVGVTAGVWELTPLDWSEPGFWERFFDGDPGARQLFNEIAEVL